MTRSNGDMFVVGISWRTAPVAVREKLAFRDEELHATLRELVESQPVAEALLVSTCNRVEVYGVARAGADATAPVRAFLAAKKQLALRDVGDAIYGHRASDAVRHVFRVAAALDSLVLGEAQILGQLKAAYGVAGAAGTSGPLLGRCLERAFGVAKRVRSETAIARGAANVSSVAVELAQRVFGDLERQERARRRRRQDVAARRAPPLRVGRDAPRRHEPLAGEGRGARRGDRRHREAVGGARQAARRGRRRDQLDRRARAGPDARAVQEGREGAPVAADHR